VRDSFILNNLLYDNHASGISLYRIDGGAPASNNVVVCNTVVQDTDGRWCLNIQDGSTGNRVFDNILLTRHSYRGSINVSPSSLPGLACDFNLVSNRFTLNGGDSILTLADWRKATGQDASSRVAAMGEVFRDEPKDDYHLLPTGPAVDAGTTKNAPAIDLEGAPRPSGAAVDIGAYEVQVP
jgi:hypothetical protein